MPALEIDGKTLIQSLPIIEYLDETHPEPPLLPPDPAGRARVRALAAIVACDIHPINNLRVLRYLQRPLGHDQAAIETWYNHWIAEGFARAGAAAGRGPPAPAASATATGPAWPISRWCRRWSMPSATSSTCALSDDRADLRDCMKLDAFAAAHPRAPARPRSMSAHRSAADARSRGGSRRLFAGALVAPAAGGVRSGSAAGVIGRRSRPDPGRDAAGRAAAMSCRSSPTSWSPAR